MKFAESWLLFGVFGVGLRALDFGLEALGHAGVALGGGKFHPLLKRFDGARYVAFAEEGSGFAEDTSVALAFFGGIHEEN